MSAKPWEQWGDELAPRRAEFMGLAQFPVLGPPQAGQVTPEGWAYVGAAALHPGVIVPSGQHWCGVRGSGCGCWRPVHPAHLHTRPLCSCWPHWVLLELLELRHGPSCLLVAFSQGNQTK